MTSPLADTPYYHSHLERFITAFGSFLDGITVIRRNEDRSIAQEIKVPVRYGPKSKWLESLRSNPSQKDNVEIRLPMVSFEIIDIKYAEDRKIGAVGSYIAGNYNNQRTKLYNPTPYDIFLQVNIITKTSGDNFNIVEQILPYFPPAVFLNFMLLPALNIRKTVPVSITAVNWQDSYEGSPEEYRNVICTMTFVAQLDLFGPVTTGGAVIKEIMINYVPTNDVLNTTVHSGSEKIDIKVNPISANKDGVYTISETWSLTS